MSTDILPKNRNADTLSMEISTFCFNDVEYLNYYR